jgi:hypothetical protein
MMWDTQVKIAVSVCLLFVTMAVSGSTLRVLVNEKTIVGTAWLTFPRTEEESMSTEVTLEEII